MDNGMLKKICIIAGVALVGFVLVVLLCMVSFLAGSMNNHAVSQPVSGYMPPAAPSAPAEALSPVEQDTVKAMAMLYKENESGKKVFRCTATAFDREGDFYYFITAAHCVSEDDSEKEIARIEPGKFYINFGLPGNDDFHPAAVEAAGYMNDGDDLAVLGVYLEKFNPIIKLSPVDAVMGERIFNVAGPLGFGRQLFRGYVSQVTPGRDAPEFLRNFIMVQIHCGGGSSGSSIISEDKKAIIGVLTAGISYFGLEPYYDVSLVVPISKFHRFWTAVKARNYEHLTLESFKDVTSEAETDGAGTGLDGGPADDFGGVDD